LARPWIEFVQSQRLPWQPASFAKLRPGTTMRVLSYDAASGAASLIVRHPAGFSAPATALTTDEEFLVLEGSLAAGSRHYGPYGYAHWPAGFDAGAISSTGGAVTLHFFAGEPQPGPARGVDAATLIERLDALEVPYTGNFHPEFPIGAGRKLLFVDPATGDTSWILGTMPLRWAARPEVHPVVEEMYLLSGEVHGNCGVMRPGAYFWRPPGKSHGPYGSLTGNVYFFRTKGGRLTTEYVEGSAPFRWWPDYAPVLPPELTEASGEVATGGRNW
jgi:hypothetical protein